MANRILRFFGQGYGPSPASITVTKNGTTVYSGTIPTVDQPLPVLPDPALINAQPALFDIEVDVEFWGQFPMTCTVTNGTVLFTNVQGNYMNYPNPIYTAEQFAVLNDPDSTRAQRLQIWSTGANPPFSAEDISLIENPATTPEEVTDIIKLHNCDTYVSGGENKFGSINPLDCRKNVTIDGVPQPPDSGSEKGTWWRFISNGSTMAYDLEILGVRRTI